MNKKKPIDERFLKYVNKQGPLMPGMLTRCWQWVGALHSDGAGQLNIHGTLILAHRLAWELYEGKIPLGLSIHHICNNRACVNPSHLALVKRAGHVNLHSILRGTCAKGHPHDNENPLIDGKGCRRCRECANEARERYNAKKAKS